MFRICLEVFYNNSTTILNKNTINTMDKKLFRTTAENFFEKLDRSGDISQNHRIKMDGWNCSKLFIPV